MHMTKISTLTVALLACSAVAYGQEDTLDEIVVVASRYEESVRRIARSVSVADVGRYHPEVEGAA